LEARHFSAPMRDDPGRSPAGSIVTCITDFADQAVILPLVLAIGIALLAQGWRRGAAAWALAVAGTFAAMLILKLIFIACAHRLGTLDIHTPSGHVAAATVVTGGLATLLVGRRAPVLSLAILVAVIIGVLRLLLGVHSLPEVLVGAVVGLAGAAALLLLAGQLPPTLNVRRIAVIAVAVVVVFHGTHLPAEAHIRAMACRVAKILSVCESAEVRLLTSSNRTRSSSPR
jgi:membrane-associated phospholipid phosphatase